MMCCVFTVFIKAFQFMNNHPATSVLNTFQALCEIASPSGHEDEVRAYIVNYLKKHLNISPFIDRAGNIYHSEAGYGEPLLLCAHIDTVLPGLSQKTVVRDGYVYSDGKSVLGADDKCAVAAMLEAIVWAKQTKKPHRAFELLFTVREETDGGIRDFPREKIHARQALIADHADPIGTLVTAAPYVTGYGITVRAQGGHVGEITAKTVHPLYYFQAFARRFTPCKKRSTITNIAIVRMGESYNSVPQSIYFTGEIRTFVQNDEQLFVQRIQQTVEELDKRYGTKSELELFPYCRGYRLTSGDIKMTSDIFKKHNIKLVMKDVYSVGDFNILSEWGITPINIGNGARDVHTTHEHISISSLTNLYDIIISHLY